MVRYECNEAVAKRRLIHDADVDEHIRAGSLGNGFSGFSFHAANVEENMRMM